jgi:hypothetical protein
MRQGPAGARLLLCVLALLAPSCRKKVADPWREFSAADGRFKVLIPVVPREQVEKLDTPAGAVEAHVLMADGYGKIVGFGLFWSEYPEVAFQQLKPEQILDASRDSAVGNIHGSLVREQKIELDGHPGREIVIKVLDSDVLVRQRMFLVGRRLYQINCVLHEPERTAATEVERFLTSFKLVK